MRAASAEPQTVAAMPEETGKFIKFQNMSKVTTEKNTAVAEAVSRTELFFSNNKKAIIISILVIIVACAGIFLYHKYGYMPARQEALSQMFPAESNFRNGEYELALNGDGSVLGFAQIADEYGNKAGKAVYLYAGICELNLGNWNEAISYLEKYKGTDKILKARSIACIGDAYTGLNDYAKAVHYFEKAASVADNAFAATYLLKAGVTYEALGDYASAVKAYRTIKDDYPMSVEAMDIDKYITRAETVSGK